MNILLKGIVEFTVKDYGILGLEKNLPMERIFFCSKWLGAPPTKYKQRVINISSAQAKSAETE